MRRGIATNIAVIVLDLNRPEFVLMESTVPEMNTLTITHIVDNMHLLIYLYRVIVIVDKAAFSNISVIS